MPEANKKRTRLTDLEALEVSLVPRGANRKKFLLAKEDGGPRDTLFEIIDTPTEVEEKLLFKEGDTPFETELIEESGKAVARILSSEILDGEDLAKIVKAVNQADDTPALTEEQEQLLELVEISVRKQLELAKQESKPVICEVCHKRNAAKELPEKTEKPMCEACFAKAVRRKGKGVTKMDNIKAERLELIEKSERGEGSLVDLTWLLIEEGGREIRKEHPELAGWEAETRFLETDRGRMLHELYDSAYRQGQRHTFAAKSATIIEDDPSKEIVEKIDALIQKGDGLSYSDAYSQVMAENPELAQRWRDSQVRVGATLK